MRLQTPPPVNREKYENLLTDTETAVLRKRLGVSVVLLLLLMCISMGHVMAGWSLGPLDECGPFAIGCIEMVLAAAILWINRAFFVNGFRGILHGSANMDTLVALGSGVSFLWSMWVLFRIYCAQTVVESIPSGTASVANSAYGLHDLYFESAAMIVTLITVGKLLEAKSRGKTTDALKSLVAMSPEVARVEREDTETEIPIEQMAVGDIFIVKAGERIPVDGIIIEGSTSVDESALTGESMPVDKKAGDSVSAATISKSGYIRARATRVGGDTTFARIIELVSDAAATKAPIARVADRIAGVFVPVVIAIACVTFAVWMMLGAGAAASLTRAVAVLVISCPCALGLATPVAIMVGSGVGARNGILFKTAAALEEMGRIQIVAIDKTGTITGGAPVVTDVFPCRGVSADELTEVAAALESRSDHPLARAISAYCRNTTLRIGDFEEVAGGGVRAIMMEGSRAVKLAGGSAEFIASSVSATGKGSSENSLAADVERLQRETSEFADSGKTRVYYTKGGVLLGVIALADSVRDDSREGIEELGKLGIRTVMLTGDRKATADSIAAEVGVDEVVAEVLPGDKEAAVRKLKENGKVAMVGDGINDAPALTTADVGIAIGAGTDIAIDSADVVLINNSIADVAAAIRLGRATLRNIKQNLFWAFFYNILLIPLAAGAFTALLGGWTLSPMIAAAAMSLSSFCVCTNALRLNLVKIR